MTFIGDWLSYESPLEKKAKVMIRDSVKVAVPKIILLVILMMVYKGIADAYGSERAFIILGILILLSLSDINRGIAELARPKIEN